MANTTFSGPVRSENGFDLINKNSVGNTITDIGLEVIEKSLTVANGATTGTTTDTLPTTSSLFQQLLLLQQHLQMQLTLQI